MKWNMKVGTVRVHGTDEVLSQLLETLTAEGREAKKANSYVEFVLTKEELSDEKGIKQFQTLCDYDGFYGTEIYRGVKYNQPIVDTVYDMSTEEAFSFSMEYFDTYDIETEYWKFINSPEYKKAKEVNKILNYEKKLNAYKERLMAV